MTFTETEDDEMGISDDMRLLGEQIVEGFRDSFKKQEAENAARYGINDFMKDKGRVFGNGTLTQEALNGMAYQQLKDLEMKWNELQSLHGVRTPDVQNERLGRFSDAVVATPDTPISSDVGKPVYLGIHQLADVPDSPIQVPWETSDEITGKIHLSWRDSAGTWTLDEGKVNTGSGLPMPPGVGYSPSGYKVFGLLGGDLSVEVVPVTERELSDLMASPRA